MECENEFETGRNNAEYLLFHQIRNKVIEMMMVMVMMMVIGPSVEVQERQFQGGQWAVWCQDWLQYTEPLNCCFYRRHLKDFLSADMRQQFNLLWGAIKQLLTPHLWGAIKHSFWRKIFLLYLYNVYYSYSCAADFNSLHWTFLLGDVKWRSKQTLIKILKIV